MKRGKKNSVDDRFETDVEKKNIAIRALMSRSRANSVAAIVS